MFLFIGSSSSSFPPPVLHTGAVANYEKVSASSGFEYETPLGDFLSVPLKHRSLRGHFAKSNSVENLVGVPALPLEPFLVVEGLSPETFPPSEVCLHYIPCSFSSAFISCVILVYCSPRIFFEGGDRHIILR